MVTEFAYAKINLRLEILGRRPDGYHDLDSTMQTLAWHDTLTVAETGEPGIVLECSVPELANEDNLVWKAAALLAREAGREPCLRITLDKQIFVAAGLGGGSSDGAAALRALNRLWGLDYDVERLQNLAARLGSDVPFLIAGGTSRCLGRGERVVPMGDSPETYVSLGRLPGLRLSTPEVYRAYDALPEHLQEAAAQNDLELALMRQYPELAELEQAALHWGSDFSIMSGSGPTVFALCATEAGARRVAEGWQKGFGCDVMVTRYQGRLKI